MQSRHLHIFLALIFSVLVTACGTTRAKLTTNDFTVPESVSTLVYTPDVELKILMASGLQETRADWSEQGEANLVMALTEELENREGTVTVKGRNEGLTERQVQLVKLTDTVMQTSWQYDYVGTGLPTRKDVFDRTIGPGAALLGEGTDADYALLTIARGSYSSGGKIAMNIAMAALGGPVQIGGQQVYAALIDLETGDIIWSNMATAAPGADMRKPEGARSLVKSLLKDFPIELIESDE